MATVKQLERKLAVTLKIKKRAEKVRDDLRLKVDELQEICEDLEGGLSDFDDGLRLLEDAVDTLSRNM